MTIEKSTTIGATTTRVRLTEHHSMQVLETVADVRVREVHVPVALVLEFAAAYRRAITGMDRETLSIKQAAAQSRVCRRTLYNWMARGKLEYTRTPSGTRRVYVDSLLQHAVPLPVQS